jgi:hypothetical protein
LSDLPPALLYDMHAFSQSEDRFAFLRHWLGRCGIIGRKIETQGYRHLLVRFNQHPYDIHKKTLIFIAHYDKVPQSPGANDNGAAVFQLLSLAGRLQQSSSHHNVQILFTDGEELLDGVQANQQGAYLLARLFQKNGIKNCRFYIFDMCGIGNTIVMGGAGSALLKQSVEDHLIPQSFYQQVMQELDYGATVVQKFQNHPTDRIYTLFSDDLGLLLNGYPAICFSVLPQEQAATAYENWKQIQNNDWAMLTLKKGYLRPEFQKIIRAITPKSWQTWHSSEDKIDYLEKRAFVLMEHFLDFLVQQS